jgi:hypothetical protein
MENIMKTKYLSAVIAALVSSAVSTSFSQPFDSVGALRNPALASSPRVREVFPWLTREPSKSPASTKASQSQSALAEVMKNRALMSSPRVLEQFPELTRPVQTSRSPVQAASIVKNNALLSSPRTLEEYPELARGGSSKETKPRFDVAPVK